jgi:hypothetical protein
LQQPGPGSRAPAAALDVGLLPELCRAGEGRHCNLWLGVLLLLGLLAVRPGPDLLHSDVIIVAGGDHINCGRQTRRRKKITGEGKNRRRKRGIGERKENRRRKRRTGEGKGEQEEEKENRRNMGIGEGQGE